MSYNITNWQTINIKDLRIPLQACEDAMTTDLVQRGWKLDSYNFRTDGSATISGGAEGFEIIGRIELIDPGAGFAVNNLELVVKSFDLSGEGSGTWWREFVMKILEKSKGELTAHLIWEGGDETETVSVINGKFLDMENLQWVTGVVSLPTPDGVEWQSYKAKSHLVCPRKNIYLHVVQIKSDEFCLAITRDDVDHHTVFSYEFPAERMTEALMIQDAEKLLAVLGIEKSN
jgi:hypothetical protein